ncbi:hypothetical protein AB4Y43_39670, partial [Paraburkholderia sp. BR10872]
MEIDVLGIDLAKQIFQLHGADRRRRVVHRSKVSRSSFFEAVRALNPKLVVMEACSTAHHWGRCFQSIGIEGKRLTAAVVDGCRDRHQSDVHHFRSDGHHFVRANTEARQPE